MAQTDVQLVIKARNEASAAVIAVADAIKTLTGAQDKLTASGGATASLLDQLKNASGSLAAAVAKTDTAVDKAAASFERQQKTLAETEASLAAVKTQMAATEAAAAKLNAQFNSGPQIEKYTVQMAGLAAEQKNLSTQARQLTSSLATQQKAIAASAASLQLMRGAAGAAGSAATFAIIPPATAATVDEAANAVRRFSDALPAIAPAAGSASRASNTLMQSLKSTAATFLTIPKAGQAAEGALNGFGGSSRTALSLSQRLRAELLSLAQTFIGLYAAAGAVREILSAYQALQSAENKLGVVFSQNQDQVSAELKFLRDEAIRLGLSFTQLADQYSAFAIAAQSAGFSLDGTRKVFVAVADASRVLHLSTEQVNNVFLALTEMLSKGEIQSTQLRKQLGTDLPGAVSLFADALGISTGKLDELMQKGELFADEDTFSKIADRLNEKYGKQLPQALQTAQTQMGRFQALLQTAEINVAEGGFIDALNSGLQKFNAYLQTNDAHHFFTEIGTVLGKLVGLLPLVGHNVNLITTAFKAWLAVRIDMYLLNLIGRMGSVAGAARAMWVAIGGVPGLIVTGIAFALQSVVGEWIGGIDKATEALDEHKRILDAIKNAYGDAGQKADDWAKKIQNATAVQAIVNLQKLEAELAKLRQDVPLKSPEQVIVGFAETKVVVPNDLDQRLDSIIEKFKQSKLSYEDFQKALNGLSEQRTTAVQELHTALSDGSSAETIDALRQKVMDLGVALQQVLPTAQALTATFGDQKQVETLQKVSQQLHNIKVGLTDAREMNTLVADTAVSAWQNFNTTLAQSRKVFVALRTAFLQFAQDFLTKTEEMILKQDLMNALGGTGVGNWLSKVVNGATGTDGAGSAALTTAGSQLIAAAAALQEAAFSLMTGGFSMGSTSSLQNIDVLSMLAQAGVVFHSGGIVGAGGTSRSVSAAIFAGARRFHSGGLPGLRANEVPAILEKGEEVLTRGDPRHVMNGGASTPAIHLRNVNVFDPGDAFAAGIRSTVGEKTMFNFVRNNKSAIKAVLA